MGSHIEPSLVAGHQLDTIYTSTQIDRQYGSKSSCHI